MNNALVTTGVQPLTIGSTELFVARAILNGVPWELTGGIARLLLSDPNNVLLAINAVGELGGATAPWTVTGPVGTWVRAWRLQSVDGIVQYSRPLTFTVISSPQ